VLRDPHKGVVDRVLRVPFLPQNTIRNVVHQTFILLVYDLELIPVLRTLDHGQIDQHHIPSLRWKTAPERG